MGKVNDFFNRQVGKFGLGIVIIVAYIGFKFALGGYVIDQDFLWYSVWFALIILSALATDLFVNNETWVESTMQSIARDDISSEEKIVIIKNQLTIEVARYQSIFMSINGFDTRLKKIVASITKIYKGSITVKEILVIVFYALWDLVVREGVANLESPYDVMILFLGIVALKIVDANSGFAQLVTNMYNEAYSDKDADIKLTFIANYIKELANQYDIEYTVKTISGEDQIQYYFDKIAQISPENEAILNEIKTKIIK